MPIDRASVKKGNNSPPVVIAARSVNVALFLSKDLRRDVTLSIGIVKETGWDIVSFAGETLRRVSPDERSISFFLLKAFEELERLAIGMTRTMDNGIVVQRAAPDEFLQQWRGSTYLARSEDKCSEIPDMPTNSIYIYDVDADISLENAGFHEIARSRTPERFILDINMIYDSRE